MRNALIIVLLVSFYPFASVQAQESAQIGIYVDDSRVEFCAYGSDFLPVDIWVWGRPGENGLIGMEFQIEYPNSVFPVQPVYSDNVLTISGHPASGIYVIFNDCQYDWVWAFRQTVMLVSGDAGLIQAYPTREFQPSPPYGFGIYDCGTALYEPAGRISSVCINFCSDYREPPLIEEVQVVDKSTLEVVFSGKVGSESAENIDNYAICNRLTSGDSISVVSATLLGGGTTVGLVLAEPFIDNTPYVLEADRVADTTGNI